MHHASDDTYGEDSERFDLERRLDRDDEREPGHVTRVRTLIRRAQAPLQPPVKIGGAR